MKRAIPSDRQLRAIGHRLKPIVTVAAQGLSPGVVEEVERALTQHELVKMKVSVGDRAVRRELIDVLCNQTGARLVQTIGNTALLLRPTERPDPRLSNLLRPH